MPVNNKEITNKPSGAIYIPPLVMQEVRLAFVEGAKKYGDYNNLESIFNLSDLYDATIRHLDSFILGEDIDKDSQINHISKAIANLMMLRQSQIQGTIHDNRPLGFIEKPLLETHNNQLLNTIKYLQNKKDTNNG